ncbi:MAG: PilT/PilU family type 4a pilus ATPase [Planctomycetes bacterium]|nr:PilT/PilU family type 4a pilus ATPase [Planctomycetota bacterium]
MAELHYELPAGKQRHAQVDKPRFVVGKRKDCDLVIDHTELSRRHLEITTTNGVFTAKDLGSTNGTRVNGEALLAPRVLEDGCVLDLGGFTMTFRSRGRGGPRSSAPALAGLASGGGAGKAALGGGPSMPLPAQAAVAAGGTGSSSGRPRTAAPGVLPPVGGPPPAAASGAASAAPTADAPSELPADDLVGQPLAAWLRRVRELGASDFHLATGAAPFVRLHGRIRYFQHPVLAPADLERHLGALLDQGQARTFADKHDFDFCFAPAELGRFRANVHVHAGGVGVALRVLSDRVPTLKELGLPDVLRRFTLYNQGIVLLTGPAGCGKSSTMAALVEIINREKKKQIITIEDPIEYAYESKASTVVQREVHRHTDSWSGALRASLREDPDVIVVGELRDLETVSVAITAAETGHLVFATLHTLGAIKTIDRLLDVFPPKEQARIRIMLSESLRGVVSQQLVPTVDGSRRVPALEILFTTPAVANLVREAKTYQLVSQLQTGKRLGMRIMDESLQELLEAGTVSRSEVLARAEDPRRFEQAPSAPEK